MRVIALLLPALPAIAFAGTLTVDVTTADDRGVVRCALFDSKKGFPEDVQKARARVEAPIAGGKAACAFPDLPAGDYGVAVLHDRNGDDELDRGFLGIPKEPLGFSNGAKIRFRAPSWKDARFALTGTDATIRIATEPFEL